MLLHLLFRVPRTHSAASRTHASVTQSVPLSLPATVKSPHGGQDPQMTPRSHPQVPSPSLASRPQKMAEVMGWSPPQLHYDVQLPSADWRRVSGWPEKSRLPCCERTTWQGTVGLPGAEAGLCVIAGKKAGTSVLQLQGTEFCRQPSELGRGRRAPKGTQSNHLILPFEPLSRESI